MMSDGVLEYELAFPIAAGHDPPEWVDSARTSKTRVTGERRANLVLQQARIAAATRSEETTLRPLSP